jgi:hypothetical protein
VHVDEAGGDDEAVAVDHPFGTRRIDVTDLNDGVAVDQNVGGEAGAAGSIDDKAVA